MSKVFVCGDIHSDAMGERKLLNAKKWIEQRTLTKDDVLIQMGDWGDIWYPKEHRRYKQDKYWQEWWASRNYTLLVVDGNHDNHDMIMELPIIEKWNGKVRELITENGSIYIAVRGEVYTINGKTFFCMGGALSTDKLQRTEGIDWWRGEQPTMADEYHAMDSLNAVDWTVDYVITHTMPSSMIGEFIHQTAETPERFKDSQAIFLDHIWNKATINVGWYCGHFHTNQRNHRLIPCLNEQGETVYRQDEDNDFVECHYKRVPKELF